MFKLSFHWHYVLFIAYLHFRAALALAARHLAKCEDICHVAKDLWCLQPQWRRKKRDACTILMNLEAFLREKRLHYHRFFWHKHGFIWFFKFSIDLASIFKFSRSINRAIIMIIAYIIDYIQHKLCLFTFSTKNKTADDDGVGLFLWSVHLIIIMMFYTHWSCNVYNVTLC